MWYLRRRRLATLVARNYFLLVWPLRERNWVVCPVSCATPATLRKCPETPIVPLRGWWHYLKRQWLKALPKPLSNALLRRPYRKRSLKSLQRKKLSTLSALVLLLPVLTEWMTLPEVTGSNPMHTLFMTLTWGCCLTPPNGRWLKLPIRRETPRVK